jgi:diaminohydroxyphosphoribosylaminopyrimidine deaminase / 5-amino-6-(5-phosphoribosylamino)uracil reductase
MTHLDWARDHVQRVCAEGPEARLVALAVASLDFRAAVDGRTRRLSSEADRALMVAWREAADVLLVGSRTLTIERYGAMLPGTKLPPIATISRKGDLDRDRILRADDPPELHVYDRDVAGVVRDLRDKGAKIIVCEGGPTLFGLAFDAGLVTDYSLTLAPTIVGAGDRLIAGKGEPRQLELLAATAVEQHLFVHYALQARKSTTR